MPLVVRIILGVLCIIAAMWPMQAAFPLLYYYIWPDLTATEAHLDKFVMYGVPLTGWKIYVATLVLVVCAAALASSGFYVMIAKRFRSTPPSVPKAEK